MEKMLHAIEMLFISRNPLSATKESLNRKDARIIEMGNLEIRKTPAEDLLSW